mmetsp:Transcript_23724/g.59209  ORF Transcript_23724/g.59209 Transcript_23724/m.59209 type:complete len:419 (-) Transcript_23724:48-1304(-)
MLGLRGAMHGGLVSQSMMQGHHMQQGIEQSDVAEETDMGFHALVIKEHLSIEKLQLTLRLGDVVYVVEEDATGWAGGYKVGEEEISGWFPRICVRTIENPWVQLLIRKEGSQQHDISEDQPRGQQCALPEPEVDPAIHAVATKVESPVRHLRAVATPQGPPASQERCESEIARLKEQLNQSEINLAAAREDLALERARRQEQIRRAEKRAEEEQQFRVERELQALRVELQQTRQALDDERRGRQAAEQELARLQQDRPTGAWASRPAGATSPRPTWQTRPHNPHAEDKRPQADPPPSTFAELVASTPVPPAAPVADVVPCGSRPDPAEAPRSGSVRAQIRALERRCTSQRQLSRGPRPCQREGRRSGPAGAAGSAVPMPVQTSESAPRISAPAIPWHSTQGAELPWPTGPDEGRRINN